jgi:cytochrome c
MKRTIGCIIWLTAVIFIAVSVGWTASLDEAKDLAIKAAQFVKVNGKDSSIAEINNPNGQFVKGELFVTLQDFDGKLLANGSNPKLAGPHHIETDEKWRRDRDGKLYVKEMIEIAKGKGSGWVTYSRINPATKKVQQKKSWVQRVEGTNLYTLCGVYQ